MDRLIALAINAAALWVADRVVDGISFVGEWWQFLIVAVAFGLVNTFLRPILRILTLPITILTLGLFLLVINALMLLLTSAVAQGLNIPFVVDDFWSALLGAIVVSIVGLILSLVVGGGRAALRVA